MCYSHEWKTYIGLTGLDPYEYCDLCGMKKTDEDKHVPNKEEISYMEPIDFGVVAPTSGYHDIWGMSDEYLDESEETDE